MSDLRPQLIRLAATFPKGSAERTALLGVLREASDPAYDLSPPVDAGIAKGAQKWADFCRNYILGEAPEPGPKRDQLIAEAKRQMGYAAWLFRNKGVARVYPGLIKGIEDLKLTMGD